MQFSILIASYGVLSSASIATPTGDLNSPSTDSSLNQHGSVNKLANDNAPASTGGAKGLLSSEHVNATESLHGPATFFYNFYMCCTNSAIDNFYPPYGCIYGPSSGTCPGASSSFPNVWLCKYEPGLFVGSIVSLTLQAL
jgi:hypothetical protein